MNDPDICVFCAAPDCLANEAKHGPECPFTTNMWPIDQFDIDREACCAACKEPFALGELSYERDAGDHPAAAAFSGATIGVCLVCAALDREATP